MLIHASAHQMGNLQYLSTGLGKTSIAR